MKKLTLISFVALLASPAMAKDVDETLDAEADGRVYVSNVSGDIVVKGWNRNQVRVVGEVGDDVEEFIFEVDGSETTIKVKVPKRSGHFSNASADLEISVPEGSSVDVGTVSADIDVSGVNGSLDLQSVSGDIDAVFGGGDIEAETVSGDVDIDGNGEDGEADLGSVSGDISADNLSGNLSAGTVSGDVDVTNGDFERTSLETVNGDIDYEAVLRDGGKLTATTVNGSIDLDFDGDVSARFEIETFNGSINNCFGPDPKRTSRYTPGLELSFTEGGGNGRVAVDTMNGSISICKD